MPRKRAASKTTPGKAKLQKNKPQPVPDELNPFLDFEPIQGRGPNIPWDAGEIFRLARIGMTQGEIAQFYGAYGSGALAQAMEAHAELRQAWEQGTAMAKMSLRRLQLMHAVQFNGPGAVQMTIHMSKHLLGEKDEKVHTLKEEENNPGNKKVEMTFNFTRSTDKDHPSRVLDEGVVIEGK